MARKVNNLIILAIISLFFAAANGEEPFDPRLNLEPGDNYLCAMNMNTHVQQVIGDRDQVIDQDLTIYWDYDVQSINEDGEYELLVTYERVKSKQKMGMQTVEFDSDDQSEYVDPSMIGYKILVGSELRLRLTPEGKVVDLTGFEKIIDDIIAELNIPDSPERDKVIEGLRRQFGDEALRQSIEQMTIIYPENPVQIGESWNITYQMDFGFPMIVDSECTLLSREDGIAVIDVISAIRSNPDAEGIDMGMFSLDYNIEGSQSGTIKLDENSGLPVYSKIEQNFGGTVSVSGATDLQEDSWPVSADGQVVITFEKR